MMINCQINSMFCFVTGLLYMLLLEADFVAWLGVLNYFVRITIIVLTSLFMHY